MLYAAYRAGKTVDKLFVLEHCKEGSMNTVIREAKKHDTVRIIKQSGHWIATIFGTVNSVSDYYGVDVNTGRLTDNTLARALYHISKA